MNENAPAPAPALGPPLRSARGTWLQAGAMAVSLVIIALLIALAGASPVSVVASLWGGAFGTTDQAARVIATLAPLLLASSGLIYTFMAGLYNLGVEGQIIIGAVAATAVLRGLQGALPAPLVVALSIVAGLLGGMIWSLLAGVLNVYGRINEIFAGLGLNFVAQGLIIYLIFGPWKRPGVASMSGTEPFDESLWLVRFGNTDASPVALVIAVILLIVRLISSRRDGRQ